VAATGEADVTAQIRRRKPGKPIIAAAAIVLLTLVAVVVADVRAHTGSDEPNGGTKTGTAATRYGASFQTDNAEGYDAGLKRVDRTLGHLDFVRVFYPGPPDPWPGKARGRNVVVSFKIPPADVVNGAYDARMKNWFAKAPRNIDIYWSFWHEPENDIQDGTFTAADYKAAFVKLDKLADTAHNPRLKSTVILQSYSTRPDSGRNWRTYVPNPGHVDVLAWDVYNRPSAEAGYQVPPDLLDAPMRASKSIGKPFAVAELGSPIAPGDDGSGRAEWLRRMGAYLDQHHALFVCYFDFVWNDGKDDYRLSDTPSVQAWRAISGK
jgi:hypothetical protein